MSTRDCPRLGISMGRGDNAKSVIAAVLLLGLMLTGSFRDRPERPLWLHRPLRSAGALVGIFTIIVDVGPRTIPDIVYHVAIVVVLIWGLIMVRGGPADDTRRQT